MPARVPAADNLDSDILRRYHVNAGGRAGIYRQRRFNIGTMSTIIFLLRFSATGCSMQGMQLYFALNFARYRHAQLGVRAMKIIGIARRIMADIATRRHRPSKTLFYFARFIRDGRNLYCLKRLSTE